MPSHYNDANTAAQQKQRSGMRNILIYYRMLKELLREQFEESSNANRPYNCFIHHNLLLPAVELSKEDFQYRRSLLAPYFVSNGTLTPLQTTVVDGCLQFQMNKKEWKSHDILRFIKLESDDDAIGIPTIHYAKHVDKEIDVPIDTVITSEPLKPGAYAYVHLRPARNGYKVSKQQFIIVVTASLS